MGKILIVGLGGFVGAILRYLIGGWVQGLSGNSSFPYGTLLVNVIGCLLIGLLTQATEATPFLTPQARLFVLIGLLGAFTTFSTFGNETMTLLRGGQTLLSLVNIGAQLLLGLSAVWAGHRLGLLVWR